MSSNGVGSLSAPPDGFSACYADIMYNIMSLTTFGLCSMVVSSTLNHHASIPKEFSDIL